MDSMDRMDTRRKSSIRCNFMDFQKEMDPLKRAETVNWLIDMHHVMNFLPETLFRAVSLLDHYLQTCAVDNRKMQLLSVTVLYAAAMRVETDDPDWRSWFFEMTSSIQGTTEQEVLDMQKDILRVVDWGQTLPVSLHFLHQYCKDVEEELTAMYLLEVCLVDYSMAWVKPLRQAAAAHYCAMQLSRSPQNSMERETPYHRSDYNVSLRPLMMRMAMLALDAPEIPNFAPYEKYRQEKYDAVACFSENQIRKLHHIANGMC